MFASLSTGVGKGTGYFFGQQQQDSTKVNSATSDNIVPVKRKKNKKKKSKKADIVQDVEEDQEEDEIEELDILKMKELSENESGNPGMAVLSNYESNHMSDPVSETIEEVIRKTNYSRLKVHACVMQMWDCGLKYDDAEAVIEQLMTFQGGKEEVENVHITSEAAVGLTSTSNRNIYNLEEFTTFSTMSDNYLNTESKQNHDVVSPTYPTYSAASPAAPLVVAAAPAPVLHKVSRNTNSSKASSDPSKAIWEVPPAVASATRGRDPVLPPSIFSDVTVTAQVENCAKFPNLCDALGGLCAWSSANFPSNKEALFESKALEIILERIISETTQIIRPEIRSRLSELLHKSLPVRNEGSHAVTSIISLLEMLAIQINSTTSSNLFTDNPQNLSTFIAYRIAASLRRLHDTLKSFQSSGNIQATLSNLDVALAETTAALERHTEECRAESLRLPAQQVDLKSAFIFRELQHERLELELLAAEALREASLQPRSQVSVPYLGGSNEDDLLLESSLLAEAGESKASIEAKKNEAFAVRSFLERVLADHTNRVTPWKNQLRECVGQIADLYQQHQLLTAQIVKVERDIENYNTTRTFLQQSIDNEQGRYKAQVATMDSSHSYVISALQLDESVTGIIQKVRELEGELSAVVIGGTPAPTAPPAEEYPVRIAAASEALGAYIESETKCIAVLARRISLVETRAIHLRREIEEYKNLGMQSVGLEIETTIKKLRENAEEDQSTLSALLSALTTAVRRVASCFTVDLAGVGMVTMPVLAITQAVATLTEAGVPVPPELLTFAIASPPPPPGLTVPGKHTQPHAAASSATAGKTLPAAATAAIIPHNVGGSHSSHNKTSSKPASASGAHPNASSASAHPPSASHSSFQSHQASQGQQRSATAGSAGGAPSSQQKPAPSTSSPAAATPSPLTRTAAKAQTRHTPDTTAHSKSPASQTPKSQGQSQGQAPKPQSQGQGHGAAAQGKKKNPAATSNPVARPSPVAAVKESKNPAAAAAIGSLKPAAAGAGGRSSSTSSQAPPATTTTATAGTTASTSGAAAAPPTSENKKSSAWKGWSKSDKNHATHAATSAVAAGPVKSLLEIQKEEGQVNVIPPTTSAVAAVAAVDSNSDEVVEVMPLPEDIVQESTLEATSLVATATVTTTTTPFIDNDKEEVVPEAAVPEADAEEEEVAVVDEEEVGAPQEEEEDNGAEVEVEVEEDQTSPVSDEAEKETETAVEEGQEAETDTKVEAAIVAETEGDEDSNPLERRSRRSRRE